MRVWSAVDELSERCAILAAHDVDYLWHGASNAVAARRPASDAGAGCAAGIDCWRRHSDGIVQPPTGSAHSACRAGPVTHEFGRCCAGGWACAGAGRATAVSTFISGSR